MTGAGGWADDAGIGIETHGAAMAASVFISYRRSDSQHAAIALAEALRWAFDDGEVFFDRSSLQGGTVWPDAIRTAAENARLVVPVIGSGWLTAADRFGRRRIDHPDDWVRLELTSALSRGTAVLPVTLEDATMPPVEAFDEGLAELGERQALKMRADSWESDLAQLIARITALAQPKLRPRDAQDTLNPNGTPIPRPDRIQRTVPPLSPEDLRESLVDLSAWRLEANDHAWAVGGSADELARTYEFRSFANVACFMADAAQAINAWKPPHHPRWENQWRVLKVWFTTWDVGCRVTKLDVDAARKMDRLFVGRDPARCG
jgi:pterin-4a-carbinolamine dehydratase